MLDTRFTFDNAFYKVDILRNTDPSGLQDSLNNSIAENPSFYITNDATGAKYTNCFSTATMSGYIIISVTQ